MIMKKLYITLLSLSLAAVAWCQFQPESFTPDQKLRAAEAIIENFYVEDVNSDTIVSEATGRGATKWGKLKSGLGWVSLDYCKKI